MGFSRRTYYNRYTYQLSRTITWIRSIVVSVANQVHLELNINNPAYLFAIRLIARVGGQCQIQAGHLQKGVLSDNPGR